MYVENISPGIYLQDYRALLTTRPIDPLNKEIDTPKIDDAEGRSGLLGQPHQVGMDLIGQDNAVGPRADIGF